ncbi:XrtA/PEP-CTERM system TPR-repeat protein PrsT [Pelotalea chapellei]|uniref:PEP-CTERM system TPR-repeat protein PrsT n=1 Tax=Pelotalea chapellei TaxID=44671 RepID=A0ABS5U5G2_9BACT|nr:XrtA/PEP-CTERM system TPR-repeat protein PrsT [Pelotalea chapellei]MBT1070901.1 PEP-CTERM system TPR-repeat protein PrsT [Pelotalea chapellei]
MKKITLIMLVLLLATAGCSRKTKEDLQAEGIKLLKEGNPGGAVVLFKSALEKDENYSDARLQLAKAYAAMGKRDQAEREFTKVLKQNPSLDSVLLELSKLAIANQKGDEAFKLAEQYLAKHPGNAEGLELLGVSSAAKKQYSEAEAYLQQALAANPKLSSAKLELASVYVAAGAPQKAQSLLQAVIQADPQGKKAYYMLAELEKGLGNTDKAQELYRKLLEINQSETFAAYKLGLILLEKEELDKAESVADGLIKSYPAKGDGHRLKGLVKFHRKEYADAINSLLTANKYAPSLEGFYFLGLCYYNRGELESALSQFRKILDNVPTSRQARIMTATVLLTQKRIDDAITEINRVLEQNSQDALAHNLLGNAYMAKGMFDEGMHELNRATKLDPKVVDAYLKKGYFYFSRGKNNEGEAELATAVQAAPDALSSRLLLASYYQRGGKTAKALSLLRAGLTGKKSDAPLYNSIAAVLFSDNKRDEGIKNLQKAKQLDPVFPASYQNLATFYAASGNYDKAIDEYATLLRNDPANVQAMLAIAGLYEVKGKQSDALAYYRKAHDTGKPAAVLALAAYHAKQKETDKALKVLDESIKSDGRNVTAMEMKGRILVGEKKYKEALKVFDDIDTANPDAGVALKINTYVLMNAPAKALEQARRIIAKYPSSARGYLVLASIYESQKDYTSALAEVKKGLRVDPLNVQALLTEGRIHELRNERDLAMTSYADALRKKSDFVPALFAQGALLDSSGKKKEAITKYREVLEKTPSYVPALNNLAYLYADGWGNKEEALRFAVTAFRQDPGNAGIMDTLGYVLLKNGRKDDAKKVLEQAVKLLPNNPSVAYHLALVYKESGEASKAAQTLQKALMIGSFPEAAAAKAMLAEVKK